MKITRNSEETATGPSDWFTGAVYVDTVEVNDSGSPVTWGEHMSDEEYLAAPATR
jgi:hypothetical protein